jgi:GAF domain-containing protein
MAKRQPTARKATKKSTAPPPRRNKAVKAGAGQENARLKRELSEALERQKATGEILAAISSATAELQPILDTIVRTASRLCGAEYALIYRLRDGEYHVAAANNATTTFVQYAASHPLAPGRSTLIGRTALEKRTVHLPDCLADPEYKAFEYQRAGKYRTMLGVPLQQGSAPIGVIALFRAAVKPFTEKQIDLVTTFANQAVIAIENARLFDEVKTRTEDLRESLQQQTATADVLKVISRSTFDLQAVLDELTQSAARLCNADMATITRQGADGHFYHVTNHNFPPDWVDYIRQVPLRPSRGSVVGRALMARKAVQVADVVADPEYIHGEQQKKAGFRTFLGVPLLREGQPIGVFSLCRKTVAPFSDKQIELLSGFADQAVIAIENVRLFDEVKARTEDLRESLQQQTATADVLKVISRSTFDLQAVLDTLISSACRLCEADIGTVRHLDGPIYRLAATHGCTPEWRDHFARYSGKPDRTSVFGRTIVEGATVHIPDVLADPEFFRPEAIKLMGFRTALGVPLIREGRVFGVLNLFRFAQRPFTPKQIELVETFADQAVIAIENVRLFDEVKARTEDLRESLQQQTATADVLKVISRSTFDLQTVLDTLVESVTHLCEADHAWLFQRDGDILRFKSSFGHGTAVHERIRELFLTRDVPIDRGSISGRSAFEGRVLHVADVLADPEYTWNEAQKIGGYRAALGAPLLRDGKVVGVIFVAKTRPEPFSVKQIDLVTTFADQAVIAIENVRLFNETQEALRYQTGSANILKVIASSPTEVAPVLKAIVESACELCEAYDAVALLQDGEYLRFSAHHGPIPLDLQKWPINRQWTAGRAFVDRKAVHIHDLRDEANAEYTDGREMSLRMGHRTILSVPLSREGESIGAIVLRRTEVHPFTEKQITLLKSFADQAVIAIENVRLFDEVQARTRDLAESLEQQTATSEVLGAISSSLEDLAPLFQKILENAVRVCGAKFGTLNLYDGKMFDPVAAYNVPIEYAEAQLNKPFAPHPKSGLGTIATTHRPVHIEDIRTQASYLEGHPAVVALSDLAGARTIAIVPMLNDDRLVGTLAIYRQEVSPFSEKQIALLENFAKQAVIAIENHRLLKELRDSLQQQTATADVLKTISRSTFDLQTVLRTLVESAARLCDADKATITRQKGNEFYRAESFGFSDEFMDLVRSVPVTPDRGSATARALLEGVVVHIADVTIDPDYTFTEGQRLGDFRTILGVPMLREGVPIGVIVLTRSEPRPFSDKQIELATTFADQAAIAIENVRLFESVEARTKELAASLEELRAAQDRLVQTEKLASLGQLTAGIAHEIKNPLNFVNNFSALSVELVDELGELLKPSPLDDRTREETDELTQLLKGNLEKVVQHGKRADSIVKNMLLHSREGSGDRRPVDINALVGESLNLAYHGARAEKQDFQIRLDQEFDPAAGEAEVLPQEITRVLLNLISNGFYATTRRKAEALDGYEPALAAITKNLGDRIEIRIRDNGTGIRPEVKDKMFNPFFTTKPPGEGTGLGLSLSHDIVVKQHAGSIEVDTRPGEFTEFRIVLPRKAASVVKTAAGN